MSPARDLPDRALKDRQKQLYGRDHAGPTSPRKAFAAYLKDTPAAPLSLALKAALIAAAVVVGLAFLASLYKGLNRRSQPTTRPKSSLNFIHTPQTSKLTVGSGWTHA